MRSSILVILGSSLSLAVAACAPKGGPVCSPVSSWSTPTFACAAEQVAVADPAPPPPEPAPAAEPPPPEPEKPPAKLEEGSIELSDHVQFENNSAKLLDQSKTLLDHVATIMKDHPELTKVQIEGHTDSRDDDKHNQRLSEARARAVQTYLVSRGIKKNRMSTKGFGETVPVADNESEEGRFKNRRVEFKIVERK